MNNSQQDLLKKLRDPFPPEDIEWRVLRSGLKFTGEPYVQVVAYVTNRAIQQRLDDVFGLAWDDEYRETPGGMLCGISYILDGVKHTRWDGAEMPSSKNNSFIDPIKTVLSNAEKRAGSKMGVGRYLYQLEAVFAECSLETRRGDCRDEYICYEPTKGEHAGKKLHINWKKPQLPAWALPSIGPQHFKDAMAAATDMEQLREAFTNAYKYGKTSGTEDMLKDFSKEKDRHIKRVTALMISMKEANLGEVTKWLNREVINFSRVPNLDAVDSIYKSTKATLTIKCEGQAFDSEPLFSLLNQTYTNRKTELKDRS